MLLGCKEQKYDDAAFNSLYNRVYFNCNTLVLEYYMLLYTPADPRSLFFKIISVLVVYNSVDEREENKMKFEFLNSVHESNFTKFRVENMGDRFRTNIEYLPIVYLMTGNAELYPKMNPYFNAKSGGFDSDKMFEEQDFSSGLNILAKLAVHLFNSNQIVQPLDIISSLDEQSFKLALNSMILRRFGVSSSYDIPEEKLFME